VNGSYTLSIYANQDIKGLILARRRKDKLNQKPVNKEVGQFKIKEIAEKYGLN